MKPSEHRDLVSLSEFANIKGIDPTQVIAMIRDGFFEGQKIDDEWFVAKSELDSSSEKNQVKPSPVKKLALIEFIIIFLFLTFAFNAQYGIFYLLYSPAIPMFFSISFAILGFKVDKKQGDWQGMLALNLFLFFLLSAIFWLGNAFNNFR